MENAPKYKKNPNQLLYWILGGGFGCSTLGICLVAAIVIGAITLFGDPQPTRFTGSWKGRFNFTSGPEDIVYILKKDGTFRQESYTLDGRKHHETTGRWGVRGSEMKITFGGGDSERAAVAWIDDNSFTYKITAQEDEGQIGLTTTFKRQ
jgi:hypothetical protein